MKLLKKLGIPAMALAGALAFFTPSPANAKVRVGVEIGAPDYTPYGYTYVSPHGYYHWHHWRHYRYYRRYR